MKIDAANRFQLLRDVDGLGSTEVGTFGTFDEAQKYQDSLGDKVGHVRYNVIDRSKNIIVDAADGAEQAELDRRIALAKQRALLITQEEENARREAALKNGSPA
jgi:hypothetical protein